MNGRVPGVLVGFSVLVSATNSLGAEQPPRIGAASAAFALGYRARVGLGVGPELGVDFAKWFRASARVLVPVYQPGDVCAQGDVIHVDETGVYTCLPTRRVSVAFALSVGVKVVDTKHWVFAPGILALRTDIADHGTTLAAMLPVDWTPADSLRLGWFVAAGYAIGQRSSERCRNDFGPCQVGAIRRGTAERPLALATGVSLTWPLGY